MSSADLAAPNGAPCCFGGAIAVPARPSSSSSCPLLLLLITLSMQFALWPWHPTPVRLGCSRGRSTSSPCGTSTAGPHRRDAGAPGARERSRLAADGLVQSLPDGVDSLSTSCALPSLLPGVRFTVSRSRPVLISSSGKRMSAPGLVSTPNPVGQANWLPGGRRSALQLRDRHPHPLGSCLVPVCIDTSSVPRPPNGGRALFVSLYMSATYARKLDLQADLCAISTDWIRNPVHVCDL